MPTVENTLQLDAPPAVVWAALTDCARYAEWNPRLLKIEGALAPGAVVTLHYKKDSWLPARFVVDVDACTPERELRWSGPRNGARALFRASHFFRLQPATHGCVLVHGEVFAGALAPVIFPLIVRAVRANHDDVNAAIVRRVAAAPDVRRVAAAPATP